MDIVERLRKNCFCSEVGSTPCRFEEECQNAFDGADEIERLRKELKESNANHELYERRWYLRENEIEQLKLANSDLQMHYDHARTECDKLRHAKFITAYALDELKEKE